MYNVISYRLADWLSGDTPSEGLLNLELGVDFPVSSLQTTEFVTAGFLLTV